MKRSTDQEGRDRGRGRRAMSARGFMAMPIAGEDGRLPPPPKASWMSSALSGTTTTPAPPRIREREARAERRSQ